MRVVVIGGTGHIGTFLVPRLIRLGHDVVELSRGNREPYQLRAEWQQVERTRVDRGAEEASGAFGRRVRGLKPDVVVDLVCFEPESAAQMVDALRGEVEQYLQCGSIWVHGRSEVLPTLEEHPRRPLDDYGRKKNLIERLLVREAHTNGFPATVLHPGHIVGPGWPPLNPAAHFNPEVFAALASGEQVSLPNFGMETVHHVHADDVAQAFVNAMTHWQGAQGESFHVVSDQAVSLRGYAEAVAGWFGREANLTFMPWDQWAASHTEGEAQATRDHISHSPNCSNAKARRLLDFSPRYTSLEAVREAVDWLVAAGTIKV